MEEGKGREEKGQRDCLPGSMYERKKREGERERERERERECVCVYVVGECHEVLMIQSVRPEKSKQRYLPIRSVHSHIDVSLPFATYLTSRSYALAPPWQKWRERTEA